ncbi:MAG TPA: LuxR C-terminal-related transcriptional regulator [Streptosporangiaceae bacterium]
MLEVFGVSEHVESVYVTLLNRPTAGVQEIAKLLGLSEEQVHDALDELARLSLVRSLSEQPGTIHPVSPEIGLEYLLAREQAELLNRQHQIECSRASVAALVASLSSHQDDPPTNVSLSQVFGLDAIRTKLEQLTYDTRREVLSLMPDGPQTSDNMEASRPLDEMLLRRGVEILTIYQESVRNDPQSRRYTKWLTDLGGQVRTTAILPLRLLIFDRDIAVVPVNPRESEVGVTIMQGSGPVAAMCVLFNTIWEMATPFGETRAPQSEISLTEQELAVVRLLAKGDTDAAISRKLGVSPRTAGRLAAEVMTRLDAKSRFQAGVRVGELRLHLRPSLPFYPQCRLKERDQRRRTRFRVRVWACEFHYGL